MSDSNSNGENRNSARMNGSNAGQTAGKEPPVTLHIAAPRQKAPPPDQKIIKSLKLFSNTYCSVLEPESMLKTTTYYAYHVTGTDDGGAVKLTTSRTSTPAEVRVRVRQVSRESSAVSAAPVTAPGGAAPLDMELPLEKLPLAAALCFDESGCVAFSINGKQFRFSKETPLSGMLNAINLDMDAMVNMNYDPEGDVFLVTADSGGKGSAVEIENLSGNAFGADGAFRVPTGRTANGCDTVAEIDGYAVECAGRELYHKGLWFFFKETTGTKTLTFTVARDYFCTMQAIQQFISELCALISDLNAAGGDAADLAEEMRDALLNQEGGTGGTAEVLGILAGSGDEAVPKPFINLNKLKMHLKLSTETVVALFTNNEEGRAMGIVHKVKECIGKYLAMWKNAEQPEAEVVEPPKQGAAIQNDELVERYHRRFAEMQSAAQIMEVQRELISRLFEPTSN